MVFVQDLTFSYITELSHDELGLEPITFQGYLKAWSDPDSFGLPTFDGVHFGTFEPLHN